jgi:hypothetical protein
MRTWRAGAQAINIATIRSRRTLSQNGLAEVRVKSYAIRSATIYEKFVK